MFYRATLTLIRSDEEKITRHVTCVMRDKTRDLTVKAL